MIKGLPPLLPPQDLPFHMQEPNSCRRCKHSYFEREDRGERYLRCQRARYSQQCRYERHETGECGPAALYWKERGV